MVITYMNDWLSLWCLQSTYFWCQTLKIQIFKHSLSKSYFSNQVQHILHLLYRYEYIWWIVFLWLFLNAKVLKSNFTIQILNPIKFFISVIKSSKSYVATVWIQLQLMRQRKKNKPWMSAWFVPIRKETPYFYPVPTLLVAVGVQIGSKNVLFAKNM